MNELQWFIFALTCIGAFNAGAGCLRQYMNAWRMLDEWSKLRAFMLCASAIVDYDLKRLGHQIEKRMVEVPTRDGRRARVAEYFLQA